MFFVLLVDFLVLVKEGETGRESVHEAGNDKNFGLFLVLVDAVGVSPAAVDMTEGFFLLYCCSRRWCTLLSELPIVL
jgi:hypothetical protein